MLHCVNFDNYHHSASFWFYDNTILIDLYYRLQGNIFITYFKLWDNLMCHGLLCRQQYSADNYYCLWLTGVVFEAYIYDSFYLFWIINCSAQKTTCSFLSCLFIKKDIYTYCNYCSCDIHSYVYFDCVIFLAHPLLVNFTYLYIGEIWWIPCSYILCQQQKWWCQILKVLGAMYIWYSCVGHIFYEWDIC